jgi:hypothetical protein
MIYTNTLDLNIAGAERAIAEPIDQFGILVYVNADPDYVACDFKIDPADEKGIAIFREFAAKIAAHYNTLKK